MLSSRYSNSDSKLEAGLDEAGREDPEKKKVGRTIHLSEHNTNEAKASLN